MTEAFPPGTRLEFTSWEEWEARSTSDDDRLRDRWLVERATEKLPESDLWHAFCALCNKSVRFAITVPADGHANFREEMVCPGCGLNARVRAGLHLAVAGLRPDASIYITEQASRPFAWLQKRYPQVKGSEFTTDPRRIRLLARELHDVLGGTGDIRFEDVTSLTMADASLDAVLSFDVLEHVPDYETALSEFARVLTPGGRLVLTAPFIRDNAHTIARARIGADGGIEHILEPEYHGDPLGDGILCFHHFGWDLAERARASGFSDARMVAPWAPGLGYCGELWTLVATR